MLYVLLWSEDKGNKWAFEDYLGEARIVTAGGFWQELGVGSRSIIGYGKTNKIRFG